MVDLLLLKDYQKTVNLFYNLEYDINALIKHLPKEELKHFADYNYCVYDGVYFGGIPRKSLDLARTTPIKEYIKKAEKEHVYIYMDDTEKTFKRAKRLYLDVDGNKYTIGLKNQFFDLWQFFKYEKFSSLDAVSLKYLKEGKLDIDSMGYDKSCLPLDSKIIEYCIVDCERTRDLGFTVIKACNDVGIFFNKPYSCAALSSAYIYDYSEVRNPIYFLYNGGYGINKKNEDIFRIAYNSYKGGRSEVCKRGYFEHVYEYDVNSMYPTKMCDLYDCFKCDWFKLDNLKVIDNFGYENIAYGFINIDIELKKQHVMPLPVKHKGYYVYGYGVFKNYTITLEEYRMMQELDLIINVKLNYGYLGVKTDSNIYPYNDLVRTVYKERKKYGSDEFINPLFKIILNSSYGKLIEVNVNKTENELIDLEDINSYTMDDINELPYIKDFIGGKYFNPIYASYITANARCMLYRGIEPIQDSFIASFTDSIISTEPLKNIKTGKELGEWEYNTGEITIIGSGVYQFVNDSIKTRTRGYHIKESINDNLGNEYLFDFESFLMSGLNQTKVKKLKESIIQDDMGEFNNFITKHKKVNLNFDKKRIWNSPMIKTSCYSNIHKVYESNPYNINKLTGI